MDKIKKKKKIAQLHITHTHTHTHAQHKYIAVVLVRCDAFYGLWDSYKKQRRRRRQQQWQYILILKQNTVYTRCMYLYPRIENSCRHGTGARIVGCGLFSRGAAYVDTYIYKYTICAKGRRYAQLHDICPSRVTAGANNTRSQFRDRFSCSTPQIVYYALRVVRYIVRSQRVYCRARARAGTHIYSYVFFMYILYICLCIYNTLVLTIYIYIYICLTIRSDVYMIIFLQLLLS